MSTIADILDRAADLIEPEGAWTQGAFGRNEAGQPTGFSEFRGRAVCWCVLGATGMAAGDEWSGDADDFLKAHLRVASLDDWNDAPERTQAEVVAKLREAAKLAREQGL